ARRGADPQQGTAHLRPRPPRPAELQVTQRTLDLKLRIWRQAGPSATGAIVDYDLPGVSEDMSFLEMLDLLNERLIARGEGPAAPSASRRGRRRRPTSSRCRRWWPTPPSTPRPASAAAPAWPPVPTAPPSCSPRPRSPTSTCCPRARPSATPAPRPWWSAWR